MLSGGGGNSADLRGRWGSLPGCLWWGCFRWLGEGARACWQGGAVICSITIPLLELGGNNPADTKNVYWSISLFKAQIEPPIWMTVLYIYIFFFSFQFGISEFILQETLLLASTHKLFFSPFSSAAHLVSETPLASAQLGFKCFDYKCMTRVAITNTCLSLLHPLQWYRRSNYRINASSRKLNKAKQACFDKQMN